MLKHIKKIAQVIIVAVQKIVITLLLIILYIVGFGATLVFIYIFKRRLLFRNCKNDSSFWNESAGYDSDMDSSLRQA